MMTTDVCRELATVIQNVASITYPLPPLLGREGEIAINF